MTSTFCRTMRVKTFEDYRPLFLLCGLMYGRHFGSKSGYRDHNPGSIYIANACVYTRDGTCVWRGDLDLASDDRQMLLDASKKLNRMLFVLREQSGYDRLPVQLLTLQAMFTLWRDRVSTVGLGARWYGTFEQLLQHSGKLASKRRRRGARTATTLMTPLGPMEMTVRRSDGLRKRK